MIEAVKPDTTIDHEARARRSDERNAQALHLITFEKRDNNGASTAGESQSVSEDPFMALASEGRVLAPPFHLLTLAMLPEQNTELTPVIETMETNIDGFGHTLQSRVSEKDAATVNGLPEKIRAEKTRLINFFNYANLRDSFRALRRKMRRDLETTGNAYWEVIRSVTGDIQGFEHLPSYQMRLSRLDENGVEVRVPTLELQEDGSFKITTPQSIARFRRFVQSRAGIFGGGSGYRMRWFKEFGDPRYIDNNTGEVLDKPEAIAKALAEKRVANEVVHFKIYSPRSPYGLPRYIGALLSIYGARSAEEINYITFKNNNIPSMAVLVSNGQLTQATISRIASFVESKIQGNDNFSKILIMEAEGMNEGEDSGQVKIELKPMTTDQHTDALFQEYGKNNQSNVRRQFRVPAIFVGGTDEITRAVADASRRLADEQVFAPEREEFDEFVNRRLFPAMGVVYHRYRSNSPNTTDNRELVAILSNAEKTGGMTPRIARLVLTNVLGMDLPPFPEDERFDPDMPFSLLMAEAVKNMADPAEPGQQVTALKRLQAALEEADGDDDSTMEEVLMPHLVKMRKRLERDLERSALRDDA